MVDVAWVIELVAGARELANSARVQDNTGPNRREVREIKQLIEALRLVYFAPRGVLALLDDLAAGNRPNQEQIETILPRFNDGEPWVDRMLYRLDPTNGRMNETLTLRAERVLREIAYG